MLTSLALVLATNELARAQPQASADRAERQAAVREAAALRFARKHHPELAELLNRLKSANAAAYNKAIKDLAQTRERLTKLQENDQERYELSLDIWTLDSRIRLLAARMTMSNDPGIEEEIRELLGQRLQARVRLLQHDRARAAARLERLDAQLEQLETDAESAIESDLTRIQREVRSMNRNRRQQNPPASQPATEAVKKSSAETTTLPFDSHKNLAELFGLDRGRRG